MKKVFITGADRGIGFALCRRFLEGGWMVFAGRFMEEWAELDGLQAEYGDRLFLVSLNVGSEESVDRAAKAVKATPVSLRRREKRRALRNRAKDASSMR